LDDQLSKSNVNGKEESFVWDDLALIQRNNTELTNEPYVTGGNPIMAGDKTLFNDMLGSTLGVAANGSYTPINRTSFGEVDNAASHDYNFFTGKPNVEGLGYSFLFRNYNADNGKWSSQDPLGYPDGWNNTAYCNNDVIEYFDILGLNTNINCLPVGSSVYNNALKITTPINGYTVAGHGNIDGVHDANHVLITAQTLAAMIKADPNYHQGQTVYLISCYTGQGTYAQELANALGTPVEAPKTGMGIGSDGSVYLGNLDANGNLDLSDPYTVKWIDSTGRVLSHPQAE